MKVVFAGPSLCGLKDVLPAGIVLRPPAKCGDIFSAAMGGATHIGLIDGTFENGMSVWHKEILFALGRGIAVAGAASMGALRAAECARFGMTGIGQIFEDYASGARTRDADVALTFMPEELHHQPLSITIVDLEATLSKLLACNAIDPTAADRLLLAARRIFYKSRTISSVITAALGAPDADLETQLKEQWVDQKAIDARLLIDWIQST